jgi:renalase
MPEHPRRHFAVIGAGIAGIACARTLVQAGHSVSRVREAPRRPAGAWPPALSPFGSFDQRRAVLHRARPALRPGACRPRPGLCALERQHRAGAGRAGPRDRSRPCRRASRTGSPRPAWPPAPAWAEPLARSRRLFLDTHACCRWSATRRAQVARAGQLHTEGGADDHAVHAGFDAVLLACPRLAGPRALLSISERPSTLAEARSGVEVAPCWTLMLAFPQADAARPRHAGPAVERRAQHPPPHRLAGARIVQARPRPGRALDGAGQRRLVARAPAGRSARVQAKLLQGVLPRSPASAPSRPMPTPTAGCLCPDAAAAGQEPSVGRRRWAGRVRRLVPGPPRRGRFHLRTGTGAGRGRALSVGLRRFAWGSRRTPNATFPLHRPLRALPDRAAACRLAGRRAGQLAGCARPRRPVAGAHRGCGHPRCVPGADRDHPAAACGLRPGARRAAGRLAIAARRLYQQALDRLVAPGQAYPCACSRKDIENAQAAAASCAPATRAALSRHLP